MSAEEIRENRNKIITLKFLTTSIYEPIGIYNLNETIDLNATVKTEIDIVYNTMGDIENYGMEIMIFSKEKEVIKLYIILEQIKDYIKSKKFKNKHTKERYIDLSDLPRRGKPYSLIRPFLVCSSSKK